jgi:pilus assembly protein Flp/PilA
MTFNDIKNKITDTLYRGIYFSNELPQYPRSQKGATMIEYILMVALIAVAAVVAMKLLGTNLNTKFNYIANCISNSANCT